VGTGFLRYTVASNFSSPAARAGRLTIAGVPFPVTQSGSPFACRPTLTPAAARLPATGGSGAVTVTVGGGCAWTAVSNAPWLEVTAGASGTGSGTVGYRVAPGTGFRTGAITINGRTFRVLAF
jgi:hypothetical protein